LVLGRHAGDSTEVRHIDEWFDYDVDLGSCCTNRDRWFA